MRLPMRKVTRLTYVMERMKVGMLPAEKVKSAIVIGAGASGLMCARMLESKGVKVEILEGRDRIGGRLYTDPDGLDMGGHWIHGGGPDANVRELDRPTQFECCAKSWALRPS